MQLVHHLDAGRLQPFGVDRDAIRIVASEATLDVRPSRRAPARTGVAHAASRASTAPWPEASSTRSDPANLRLATRSGYPLNIACRKRLSAIGPRLSPNIASTEDATRLTCGGSDA